MRIILRALIKQIQGLIDALESGAVLSNDSIDLFITGDAIQEGLEEVWTKTALPFGKIAFGALLKSDHRDMQIKQEFNEDLFNQIVLAFLNSKGADKVTLITESTRRIIKRLLAKGIEAGDSPEVIARSMKKKLRTITRNRARTIARTEVIAASNLGAIEGAKQTGLDLRKEWITTLDDRVRGLDAADGANHVALDGQEIGMDEVFIERRTGDALLFPGDTSNGARAANIVNCRCTVAFITQ